MFLIYPSFFISNVGGKPLRLVPVDEARLEKKHPFGYRLNRLLEIRSNN